MIKNILSSTFWQACVFLSPIAILVIGAKYHEDFFRVIPPESELRVLEGEVLVLGSQTCGCQQGSIKTSRGAEEFSYRPLSKYGWGPKSFPGGTPVSALVYDAGSDKPLAWDLTIGNEKIYDYDMIAREKTEKRDFARQVMLPLFVVACLFSLQLLWQSRYGIPGRRDRKEFYLSLDRVANRESGDEDRLRELENIKASKSYREDMYSYLYMLSDTGSVNTESETMLQYIGKALAEVLVEKAVHEADEELYEEEIQETLLHLQPVAKQALLAELQEQKPELLHILKESKVIA